jgi:hypothetical protein
MFLTLGFENFFPPVKSIERMEKRGKSEIFMKILFYARISEKRFPIVLSKGFSYKSILDIISLWVVGIRGLSFEDT